MSNKGLFQFAPMPLIMTSLAYNIKSKKVAIIWMMGNKIYSVVIIDSLPTTFGASPVSFLFFLANKSCVIPPSESFRHWYCITHKGIIAYFSLGG